MCANASLPDISAIMFAWTETSNMPVSPNSSSMNTTLNKVGNLDSPAMFSVGTYVERTRCSTNHSNMTAAIPDCCYWVEARTSTCTTEVIHLQVQESREWFFLLRCFVDLDDSSSTLASSTKRCRTHSSIQSWLDVLKFGPYGSSYTIIINSTR